MAELLQRREDPEDTLAALEEAERLIAVACDGLDDPFAVHRLKEAQFAVWQIRTNLVD